MKKVLSLLLVSATLISVSAQAQDAKAKTILDKVSSKFKSAKTMKADFTLTINGANGKSQGVKKGTFLMKGNKYKVDMSGQQIICDAKSVWTYMPANKEVQISAYNPAEQTISPAKLFSGAYEREYKYTYSGQKTIGGKKVDVIDLVPVNGSRSFTKVQLYVDPAASMVTGGNILEKNGGSYTYTIANVKSNAAIDDGTFTFNPATHPGVEVIDLR